MSKVDNLSKHPLYRMWVGMLTRCSNPNCSSYKYYGEKGIKVCARWLTFRNFVTDMGERPVGTSIDRINSSGDYEPSNCRWASIHDQNRNKCTTILIEINGTVKCAKEWSLISGRSPSGIVSRLRRGWSNEDAVFAPPRSKTQSGKRFIVVNGESKIARDWSLISGIKRSTILMRLKAGWSAERAVFELPSTQKR